jgi:serine/threonine protein kinase
VAKVAAEVGSAANRYQILARLAVGGMAEIFLARGAGVAGIERYCVLKRIIREYASDAEFVAMFLDEARLATQLQHPNIAPVYDIGLLGDSYFFTMEYVHGETVRALLQRSHELRRPVPLACALTIAAGAAAGLHHAHERYASDGRPLGIVHRDVSPSNVMVSYEGNIKLVDFGVAKAADRAVQTRSGTVKGKISYLSPEQCTGGLVDRRSDLFSLGIVLWELLTCARLYRRSSDLEAMNAIVYDDAAPPSARRADLPPAIDDIVLRMLAKAPADRFQTAAEVIEAIENAALRGGILLSASPVNRWVRELFGTRMEPWLELDRDTVPSRRVTLQSTPIPAALIPAPVDPVERDLAEVVDLHTSSVSVDLEDADVPEPAARARSRATRLRQPANPARPPRPVMPTIAMPELSFVLRTQTPIPAGAQATRPQARTWPGAGTPPVAAPAAGSTAAPVIPASATPRAVPLLGPTPTVPMRRARVAAAGTLAGEVLGPRPSPPPPCPATSPDTPGRDPSSSPSTQQLRDHDARGFRRRRPLILVGLVVAICLATAWFVTRHDDHRATGSAAPARSDVTVRAPAASPHTEGSDPATRANDAGVPSNPSIPARR